MYFPAERSMPLYPRTRTLHQQRPPFFHFLFHPLLCPFCCSTKWRLPSLSPFSGTSQPLFFAHAAIGQRRNFGSLKQRPILWQSVILTNQCTSSENGRSLSRPQHSSIIGLRRFMHAASACTSAGISTACKFTFLNIVCKYMERGHSNENWETCSWALE